ncbi:FAD-dependent oxidoreductase [bacterium]|nr:FAD-dependent oxidoreductase [bacterium]
MLPRATLAMPGGDFYGYRTHLVYKGPRPKRPVQERFLRVFVLFAVFCSTAMGGCLQEFLRASAQASFVQIFENAGVRFGGGDKSALIVHDPKLYPIVLSDPLLKLGETYVDGLWDPKDLSIDEIVYRLQVDQNERGLAAYLPMWRTPFAAASAAAKYAYRHTRDALLNRQNRSRALMVAQTHYDAGNGLYRLMLDPTLTYTSGIWAPGFDLEDSQNAKYDLIAKKIGLRPGQEILDIGCGFGGFARFASKHYQAKVTGITISVEQLKLARVLSEGDPRVEFVYADYRDIPHQFAHRQFDHVVSIEMIEAVGHKNLGKFFHSAHSRLKEGGRLLIQGIAADGDRVNTNPWFDKYIFTNGVAVSSAQLDRAAASTFGVPRDRHDISDHYDPTLLAWHQNFNQAWPELQSGYGDRFKRVWDFYLLSVAGMFRAGGLRNYQTIYAKGGDLEFAPERELASLDRLRAMKATAEEKARVAHAVSQVEAHTAALDAKKVPRDRPAAAPLAKDATIAIIGAGPSGISTALELRRLGYRNVVLFEKDDAVGGKSHTVQIDGRPHDLGATMGIPGKYQFLEDLSAKHQVPIISFPGQVYYDLKTGKPEPAASLAENGRLAFEAARYFGRYGRLSGSDGRGLEVPPAEMADPMAVVLNRNGMGHLSGVMTPFLIGYGYGGPETPAVFGHRMFDRDTIRGVATSKAIMWRDGTQPLWKAAAKDLDVRTASDVRAIRRDSQGVQVWIGDDKQPQVFDRLVIAADPQSVLGALDASEEEKALFSQIRHMPYSTFAVRVRGFAEGRAEVGMLRENMTLTRMGHPMGWVKRYPDAGIFIFHLFAPESLSDDQVMASIREDMGALGATSCELISSRRWPFFPHVDSRSVREEFFFQRMQNLQGLNRTVYVNEVLSMSTMADVAGLAVKVARRLASGEY